MKVKEESKLPKLTTCTRCNYVSSQEICKACTLLEGLNRGLPRLGIGKTSKVKKLMAANQNNECNCAKQKCNDLVKSCTNLTLLDSKKL